MGHVACYCREKAGRCRWLAASIVNRQTVAALLKLADKFEARAAKIESIDATYAARGTAPESAMADWFVRYLDVQTNRETESRRMETRDEAVALAHDRERDGCVIRSIVGPDGEEVWTTAS